jgi:VWFA-related protein
MPPFARRIAVVALLCLPLSTPPSEAKDKEIRAANGQVLNADHTRFLVDVEWLISRAERKSFLALDADYQREGFIRRFWEARDPYPETTVNEFQVQWTRRLEEAESRYKTKYDDRYRVFVVHGDPSEVRNTECGLLLWPLEIWSYREGGSLPRGMVVLFYKPGGGGPSRRWRNIDGYSVLRALPSDSAAERAQNSEYAFLRDVDNCSRGDQSLRRLFLSIKAQSDLSMEHLVDLSPKVRDTEWLQTFRADSTELKADTPRLEGKLDLAFPERDRGRTLMQGVIQLAGAEAGDFDGKPALDIRLVGEVLRDGALHENFRYRYAIPREVGAAAGPVAITFERALRPGNYHMVLRAEDLRSGKAWRDERDLTVPQLDQVVDPGEAGRMAAAAQAVGTAGVAAAGPTAPAVAPRLEIVAAGVGAEARAAGDLALGAARFEAKFEGAAPDPRVKSMVFFLDGKRMLERARPPYSVDLRLDDVPRTYRVRAVALDAQGQEVASAERLVNPPRQSLLARLLQPALRDGQLVLEAEIELPDGEVLERVDFQLNGRLVATVEQAPFRTRVPYRRESDHDFVTATAVLPDGHSAEDVRWVTRPEIEERVDVRWVQIPVTVEDANHRPVAALAGDAFRLFDGGAEKEILRFETSDDAALQILLAVDTSASMTQTMDEVRSAALEFLQTALRPKDRAAVLTFADRALLSTELTADADALKRALASLSAERGTAVWDALMQGLVYLQGARGQSAIILMSDGRDQTSKFTFDQVVEMAQRSGIAIYTLGVKVGPSAVAARRGLCKLADATGAKCFFADDGAGLKTAYAAIQEELRQRYVLTFEAGAGGETFRPIEVRLADSKLKARTLAGYWP